MIISGQYNLQTKIYKNTQEDAFSYEDEDVIVVSDTSYDPSLPTSIAQSYKEEGLEAITRLNQMYLLTIFDKNKKELFILSDLSTSKFEVYYTMQDHILYYSTSLKRLLVDSKIERVFHYESAREFLENHFLIGENTLIKNVYKLKPLHVLKVKEEVIQEKIDYPLDIPSTSEAKHKYVPLLREMVKKHIVGNKVAMPLSSGYDTSFILDTILREGHKEIDAFCVGSLHGNNEIPDVEETCKAIKEINLHIGYVKEEDLNDLADIVWRLDGIVYETGIFLQYALAKLVSKHNISYLLCGECNDEIQNPYYLENMKDLKNGKLNDTQLLSAISNPYLYSSRVIQKKSAIMLNSFKIHTTYPFVDKRLMEVAYPLKGLNGKRKWYFKRMCKKNMLKVLSDRMRLFRVGGTTGIDSLMDETQMKQLETFVNASPVIQQIDQVSIDFKDTELSLKLMKEQEKMDRMKQFLFRRKPIKEMEETPLIKLYLLLFYELFITNKYDEYLTEEGLPLKTRDIIDFSFANVHN